VLPTVSVVVPSLRGGQLLLDFVSTLLDSGSERVQVVVADNGMPAHDVDEVRARGAAVVDMGGNVGFGRAVNRAARTAEGAALIVANDDLRPEPGFLEALVAALDRAEAAAGVLLRQENRDVIETAGLVVDRALGPHDHLQGERVSALDGPVPPPLGPTGGAAAFRREVFRELGGYDEAFFAYLEDLDLALRLRAAGARVELARYGRAVHVGSATLGYQSLEKAMLVGWGRGYLLRKYGLLKRPAGIPALLGEAAASLALARRHHSLEPARARVRGWRACTARASAPADVASVRLLDGYRRRRLRAQRR
jgi:N-acetylglucosaminyl-diphospho-decaprenol L-rhamnosyltransferase